MAPPNHDNWVRKFDVSDPQKHSKGFTVYKVTSVVYPKNVPENTTKVIVWKRYNDFKKLHHQLQIKHKRLYLKDKFPQFAKAKFFGRFEDEVIEERRKCALNLLEFASRHLPLYSCSAFIKFFECSQCLSDEKMNQEAAPVIVVTEVNRSVEITPEITQTEETTSVVSSHHTISSTEMEGPFLSLGGTWKFPQVPDSISLSSHSSDDHTTFTDTDSAISSVSTPLQSSDLQFFDPLSPEKDVCDENCKNSSQPQISNSWLLSMPISSSNVEIFKNETIESFTQPNCQFTIDGPSNSKSSVNSISEHHVGHTELPSEPFFTLQAESNSNGSLGEKRETVKANDATPSDPFNLNPGEEVNYIFEAAYHVGQAQEHEVNGNFDAAFAFYKTGIACLLSGVQGDTDFQRKQLVRDKTAKYLLQAEKIYNEHLATQSNDSFKWKESVTHFCRPTSELKSFKVLGIIENLMLVINTLDNSCYVMKPLHKSPQPIDGNKGTILPQNVPYMAKMHYYYETESSIFLVLNHASGGRLWDHISSFFQSLPETPIHDFSNDNVYFGKKFIPEDQNSSENINIKSVKNNTVGDTTSTKENESISSQEGSYLELIHEYTSAKSNIQDGIEKLKLSNIEFDQVSNIKSESSVTGKESTECVFQDDGISEVNEISNFKDDNSNCDIVQPDNYSENRDQNINNSVSILDTQTYSISWKNLENLNTTDLVKSAKHLIKSVTETLLEDKQSKSASNIFDITDSLVTVNESVNTHSCDETNKEIDNIESNAETIYRSTNDESNVSDLKTSKTRNHGHTSIERCKSEETVDGSFILNNKRRRSTSRKRSVTNRTNFERRFSNDDLFDRRPRTLSGSLDRGTHFSKLQSIYDCPKPHLPEAMVREWAAELLVCLESLHKWGIICRDLRPDNILLGEKGHLMVTYICHFTSVDSVVKEEAVRCLYTAPEVNSIFPVTTSADWWSFGAIIFELCSGKSLVSCHPGGIHSHTFLNIPDYVSEEAADLINKLLKYDPKERLGSSINGAEEIKSHEFFKDINWKLILSNGNEL